MALGDAAKWFDFADIVNNGIGGLLTLSVAGVVGFLVGRSRPSTRMPRAAVDPPVRASASSAIGRDPLAPLEPFMIPVGKYGLLCLYSWIATLALTLPCVVLASEGGWSTVGGWLLAVAVTAGIWFVTIRQKKRESDRWWPICITMSVLTLLFAWGMVLATTRDFTPRP